MGQQNALAKLKVWLDQWRKFSFAAYREDFTSTSFFWLLGLIGMFVLFQIPIKKLFDSIIIDPIISSSPRNGSADLIFGLFFILSIAIFFRRLVNYTVPTINSVIFCIAVLSVYFVFVKADQHYHFYHYTNIFTGLLTYSSSFIISILLIAISYKSYFKPLTKTKTRYSLIDDSPTIDNRLDLYGREGYAKAISSHISGTSSEVSFAIGIVGDWGSGKSDFMLRLKKTLANDKDNIITDFNPWRVHNLEAIIEEFFTTLSKKLAPYNQSISQTINDYSHRVLQTAEEPRYKLIGALIGGWFHKRDIQESYEAINDAIKTTSKRIVVFIDDVDRLTGKEVMEILRIIRNTANFANTFFIVGMDQNYVIKVLKNTNDFAYEEEYLKKVFQLTITLPAFKKEVFAKEIRRYLFTPDIEESYRKEINFAMSKLAIDTDGDVNIDFNDFYYSPFQPEFLLEKMIGTIRDLKRFCNSFKIVFNILKDEAEISDLIVLELIRNKNISVYNNIRDRWLLDIDPDQRNMFVLKSDKWDSLKDQLPENDRAAMKQALDFLFTDNESKNQRKLIFAHNFYIYFSYQLFTLISFHDFNTVLRKDTDEILTSGLINRLE